MLEAYNSLTLPLQVFHAKPTVVLLNEWVHPHLSVAVLVPWPYIGGTCAEARASIGTPRAPGRTSNYLRFGTCSTVVVLFRRSASFTLMNSPVRASRPTLKDLLSFLAIVFRLDEFVLKPASAI